MSEFILRPVDPTETDAESATLGVKFSQGIHILDPWHIFGGTKWNRTLFRLRHPIVYFKRGILGLNRRIKRLFVKEPPMIMLRKWINKEEVLHLLPKDKK